jgi:perosamine synthetase
VIPLSVPHLGGREWAYVKECLDTGWVSSAGAFVDRFEKEMARYTGANHAVACSCGTAALHIALIISGVGADDEVIVPTLTFVATVNAVRYTGAHPVFMDCDCFYNIDPQKTLRFLREETFQKDGQTWNKRTGRRVAAILPVHVFGNAAELDELLSVCRNSGIRVVEDAAESLGTVYKGGQLAGKHTGTVGDVGALSFNGNKIITTGGGGMVLTNNAERAARARYLTTQAKDDEVRFIHHEVGYNYRMNNVQAALGLAQLEQLPEFLDAKRRHYGEYAKRLEGIQGLTLAPVPPYAENNHWLCAVQIDASLYELDRDSLMQRLSARGIQARPVWYLNHLQRPYLQCQSYQIERALDLWESTLNLPSSVGLTQEQLEMVSGELRGCR